MNLCLCAALLVILPIVTVWAADAQQDQCVFAGTGDENSKAINEGKAKIAPLLGHSYTSYHTEDTTTYQYSVGICSSPDPTVLSGSAAVIQQELEDGQPKGEPRVIGTLSHTHIMAGTDWVVLEYKGGETYQTHCTSEGKRTVLMMQCDDSVDDSSAQMVFMSEERDKETDCYFLFEMKHKALCPPYTSASGLSVGSILVIVFLSVAAVYLLVGFLYSRFVLGSKGLEQIPNYEFWKDFGNLQADGCDFVCRTKDRRRSQGFGGIGDDQLEPTEEIIRDDNLLPM